MKREPTKLCTGPAHAEPTELPLTAEHWYFHHTGLYAGKPTSRCRLCTNWAKLIDKRGPHGLVPAEQVERYARELVNRCGSLDETARRHRVHPTTLRGILEGVQPTVRKRTAERLLRGLAEQRKQDRLRGAASARHNQAVVTRAKEIGYA